MSEGDSSPSPDPRGKGVLDPTSDRGLGAARPTLNSEGIGEAALVASFNKRVAESGGDWPVPRPKRLRCSSEPQGSRLFRGVIIGSSPMWEPGEVSRAEGASGRAASRVDVPGLPPSGLPSGRKLFRPSWAAFEDESALGDPEVARKIVHGSLLPVDRARLDSMPVATFVNEVNQSAIRQLHQAEFMTNFYEVYERRLEQFNKEARAAEAQMETYGRRLLVREAKLRMAEDRAEEMEAKVKEAGAQLEASEARRRAAERRAEDAFQRFRAEEDERLTALNHLGEAEAEILRLEGELDDGRRERDLLQKRIGELEVRGRVEANRVREAMEDLRHSEEFQEELREGNLEGFVVGFRNCMAQAQRMCPGVDFSGLRPRTAMIDLTLEEQTVLPPASDPRGGASGAVLGGPSGAAASQD